VRTGQIPLDLVLPARLGLDDFLVAPSNAAIFAAVTAWPHWPDRMLLLVGPEGAGKSHLASIWAEQSGAAILAGGMLAAVSIEAAATRHAVIDDADQVGTQEAHLFHILNTLREHGRSALLTARRAPDAWGLRTPDLLSRLRLAPMLRPDAPDDALVRAVLVKLLTDRQLVVDTPVVDYLASRMERSIEAARQVVAALDRTSLAAGRRITRAVAAEALATLEAADASRHGDVTGVGENPGDP
jgi:chromosomal replication initiation ATPase DnaA